MTHNLQDARRAWQKFSKTGAVGAYLTYRAVMEHEKKNPEDQ